MSNVTEEGMVEARNWLSAKLAAVTESSLPVSEVVEVTPALASVILKNNPNNRNIKPSKLRQIETDMQDGRFMFNGESVVISKEGYLNDGQHRLTAVVNTEITVPMLLIVGVDRESRTTIDIGTARTAGDILNITGVANGATASAAARKIISYEEVGGFGNGARVSATKITDRVRKDGLLTEIVTWSASHHKKFKPFKLTGSDLAAVFYILSKKAPKQAKQFMEQFRDGAYLDAESPIHVARQNLLLRPKDSAAARVEVIVRAWNYWIRDDKVSRIQLMGRFPDIKGPKK